MMTRFATALVSLTTLTLAACGSSSDTSVTPGTGGNTAITPGATGGTNTAPTGNGGTGATPSGAGGTVVSGNGGTPTTPSGGSGGTVVGSTGGATTGTGGASTAACDDNALPSAKDPCVKGADPCNLHSGYAGDDYCIPPPPEGKGIQIHFGPSDYQNPTEVAKYLIKPNQEFNAYGLATIPGSGEHYYNYVQIRMRPGSHHLINTLVTGSEGTPDGYIAGALGGCPGTPVGSFPGSQNLIRNMPAGGKQAPENVGLGSSLPGGTRLCLNHHAYNFTADGPLLREIWINVWFVDAADVTQKTSSVTLSAGPYLGIPPHTKQVLKATANINGTGRIIDMFGHRHAATDRFAVWKNDELVYDSWHWDESVAFDYDSLTVNPTLAPDAKKDGATSGILAIKQGDKINIECDVNNTTDNTLTFKNELYTGEMCILFGSSVGTPVH